MTTAECTIDEAIDTLRREHSALLEAHMALIDLLGDVQDGRSRRLNMENLRHAAAERFRESLEIRELVIAFLTGDTTGIDQLDAEAASGGGANS